MKKVVFEGGMEEMFICMGNETKSIYRSILKHSEKIYPSHCNFPIIKSGRVYGVLIDYNDMSLHIIGQEQIAYLLYGGWFDGIL